jgi:hypothetical protein
MLQIGAASILLISTLLLVAPWLVRSRPASAQTRAVNNARQIGIALFEFQTEYRKFPGADTVEEVRRKTGSDLDLGENSSNDFFRQLLASGMAQSEVIFHAKVKGARQPDGIFTRGEALKKGECGFTYFVGALESDNPRRPIVVAPMISGTDRFDPKPFEGKAVVLKLDNSMASLPIDKDGHVFIDGRNMMETHHPIWDGHAPVIAWPE